MKKIVIKICAWCPSKEKLEKKYTKLWFTIFHWICEKCAKTF